MSDEVKLLPCGRCNGRRTVPDVKPGTDPLTVYPERMPCPECTDGTWADTLITRPPIGTDEVVERVARAICCAGCLLGTPEVVSQLVEANWADHVVAARAAIAAMKDAASV